MKVAMWDTLSWLRSWGEHEIPVLRNPSQVHRYLATFALSALLWEDRGHRASLPLLSLHLQD